MAGKTVVFYSPKEVDELKKLNRQYRKGNIPNLRAVIADWAKNHNRSIEGVFYKFYDCVKTKKRRYFKSIKVNSPKVNAPKVFVNHTNTGQFRIPITGIQFEPGFMIVSY
jgi:hypothetical protein